MSCFRSWCSATWAPGEVWITWWRWSTQPRRPPSSTGPTRKRRRTWPLAPTLPWGLRTAADAPAFQRSRHGRARTRSGRNAGPDAGRWRIYVRHRAGSLEAVVARARLRSLAVTAGVLLLLLVTAAALVRFTRRAQRLASLQMDFVAGVSHELRTPLAVIHTAAYNLQGKMAQSPAQVERYGALIQKESGRLKELVEQVLQFATAEAGRAVQDLAPVSIETVIEEAMESSKPLVEGARCVVEKNVDPGLPPVLGDRVALRQALENLIHNAVKYGLDGGNWIAPHYATDQSIYLTYVEPGDYGGGLALARARLSVTGTSAPAAKPGRALASDAQRQWRPVRCPGRFFAGRKYLFLAVGDRQRITPAQDPNQPQGKILRLTLDGKPAQDNPNFGKTGAPTIPVINPPADTEAAKAAQVVSTYTFPVTNLTPAETWTSRNPHALRPGVFARWRTVGGGTRPARRRRTEPDREGQELRLAARLLWPEL